MTRRLTKEELDEQFELFLKESVSDDSVDLGSSEKQTGAKGKGQKSAQKPTVSWWEDDDDKEKSKRRFIKTPKRQAENAEVARPPEPVPKPRSSAPVQSHSAPVTEQDVYRTKPSLDASPSVNTNTPSNLREAPAGDPGPEDKPLSSPDSDPQGGSSDELGGSGKSFLKSLRKTQTIREEEEDEGADRRRKAEVPKRDNTETQGLVLTPALASVLGMDTLEEEEEKARFFAELEAGASSTIDYSKLNKDLDSMTSTGVGKIEEVLGQTDNDQIKDKENPRESPGSPHYSEDFEDEGDGKGTEEEEKLKLSPILAKVSLYDSLDDTRDVDSRKTTAASLDKGQSYGQSGGSDMEALHEAYRQIQVVQDSGELNRTFLSSENRDKPDLPESPASPPPHLRPASTYESDLPTAEELMKPIRPEDDHLRGFSLQPVTVSSLDHIQGKPSESKDLQRTFTESPQRKPEDSTTSRPPTAPEPPLIQERTWNIRDEVARLMQDQESSNKSAQTNRAKKPQASRPTTGSRPSPSSSSLSLARRPTAAPVRGRSLDSKTTLMSRPSSVPGPNPLQSSYTKPSQPRSTRTTKGPEKTKNQLYSETGSKVSSDLVESVQSLVSVLQQQIHTKHQEPATTHHKTILQHSPPRQKEEDSSVVEDLRSQLLEKEKQLQQLKQDADELNSLKQQNYLLQSKLRSAEETIQKNRWTDATDSAQQEKLQQIDKEMKEQETLIQGYQQENERLYQQMKAQQARTKANEEAMFNENQRLLSELAFTREQLNKTQKPVSNLCSMDHSQRITQLLAQINVFQRNEVKQSEEICHLKQEKQALEVDLQLLKKERDQARDWVQNQTKDQATSFSGDRVYELRVMEEKHREEVSELKRKLAWFAENQELLDRDAARLRAATAEILQLKEQVEKLKMEVSKRSSEQQQQKKSRDKSADAKRMRDLERQVKELEQILRSRNPNSLPALIFAAASAPDPSHPSDASPPSRVTALLERRVRRLEAELEAHDEEAKRTLRAMEQQFQTIRMRYEQQISELEQQLVQNQQKEVVVSDPVQVQSLTEELRREREAHRQKETALQNQLDTLQQQLKLKAHSSPSRHQRQAEAALGVRLERLNQELSTKTRTIQDLTKTVERLQRERRNMLSVPVLRPEGRGAEAKRPAVLKKTAPVTVEQEETTEMFPEAQCEKTYQPTVFTGSHISEVLQENEALQQRLQQIQADSERERWELKAEVTEAQDQLSRLKEEHSKQLSSVQAEHLRAETQLRSAFALEHSSSAVAELSNQLHTQQILVQHLQDQLKELQSCREALTVSKTREDALQKQLSRLLQDLKEARDSQSPEVKLLWTLERKIHHMEQRHQHRERELQQVIGAVIPDVDLHTEVDRWKRVAQDKTRELECFRLELDSILDIIRHLQKQGVVLPAPDLHHTVPPTR